MGREVFSALLVLSKTNEARTTTSTGMGTARRARSKTPTAHLLCYCVPLSNQENRGFSGFLPTSAEQKIR